MFLGVINRFRNISAKQLAVAAGFVAAMIVAVGLGLAAKQFSSASTIVRDCDDNAILRCGAATPKEFIADVRAFNERTQKRQPDLQKIYASKYANLPPSKYDRFEKTAKMGEVYRNGDVKVDGQTVLKNAKSMGRQKFNSQRLPIVIEGKTYYYSTTQHSFASGVTSIPVMVMFDSNGVAESIIMTSCGNPTWGDKVTPEYRCNALNSKEVGKNTYEFTTNAHAKNNATVKKVVYDFGDGSSAVTKTNPSDPVRHTYTKPGTHTAKVTIHFNLPGKQEKVVVPTEKCTKKITVEQPYFACDLLEAKPLNDEKTHFRFAVKARYGNGATLKDVDFTLDDKVTTTGVTTKDEEGNIYKDYTFERDGKEHAVVAKVNFNLADGIQSKTCEAKAEAGKTPECKPGVPVGSPECEEEKCPLPGKGDLPKDSSECEEVPEELPNTGMGNMLGLFAGTSVAGAAAHRVVVSRRQKRS